MLAGFSVNTIAIELPASMLTADGKGPDVTASPKLGAYAWTARPSLTVRGLGQDENGASPFASGGATAILAAGGGTDPTRISGAGFAVLPPHAPASGSAVSAARTGSTLARRVRTRTTRREYRRLRSAIPPRPDRPSRRGRRGFGLHWLAARLGSGAIRRRSCRP